MREYIAIGEYCAPLLVANQGPFHGLERDAWLEHNAQRDRNLEAALVRGETKALRRAGLNDDVVASESIRGLIADRTRLHLHALRLHRIDRPPPSLGAPCYDDHGRWRAQRETEVDAIMGVYISVLDATRSHVADIMNRGLPAGRRPTTSLKIRNAEETYFGHCRLEEPDARRWRARLMIHEARVFDAMWCEITATRSVTPLPDRIMALARTGDLIRMYQRLYAADHGAEVDGAAGAEKLRALLLAYLQRRLKQAAA
jgi:hypothetical protein